jgi:two-component system response regulator DevR
MTSVFLVDDHELVRRGVADLLDEDPGLQVVGQAGTVSEALAVVPALRPDVAVLDLRLPDGTGIELCRALKARLPGLHCLILTSFSDEQAMVDAAAAGADGYVIKDVRGTDLVRAVREVADGRPPAPVPGVDRLPPPGACPPQDPLAGLTRQERAVVGLVAEGLTNRQIGEQLFLTEKTVKNYVSRVLTKLDLERRTQVAVLVSRLARTATPPRAE